MIFGCTSELIILLMTFSQRTGSPQTPVSSGNSHRHKTDCGLTTDLHTDYTSSAPLHSPLNLNSSLSACPFASNTWGFRHMRLFICAWLPNLQARGRTRGHSAWCCELPWETDKVQMPLWPRSVGIARVTAGFPYCRHIQALISVTGRDHNLLHCYYTLVLILLKHYYKEENNHSINLLSKVQLLLFFHSFHFAWYF